MRPAREISLEDQLMTDFFNFYPKEVLDRLRDENLAVQQARIDNGEMLYSGCVNGPGPNLRPCRCPYCYPHRSDSLGDDEELDLDAIADFDPETESDRFLSRIASFDDDDFDPTSDEAYQQDVNDSLYP